MAKRQFDEWDVSDIEESQGAAVHGVITNLSPVKVSRRNAKVHYFDGKISDGRKSVHLVAFDPSLRSAMESSRSKGSSVRLVNCLVKACGRSSGKVEGDVEIMATSRSKVEISPRKFVVTTGPADEEPSLVKLKEVDGLGTGQLVTVMVKVMDVGAPEKVKTKEGKELSKQECKICDDSGCVRLIMGKGCWSS